MNPKYTRSVTSDNTGAPLKITLPISVDNGRGRTLITDRVVFKVYGLPAGTTAHFGTDRGLTQDCLLELPGHPAHLRAMAQATRTVLTQTLHPRHELDLDAVRALCNYVLDNPKE